MTTEFPTIWNKKSYAVKCTLKILLLRGCVIFWFKSHNNPNFVLGQEQISFYCMQTTLGQSSVDQFLDFKALYI